MVQNDGTGHRVEVQFVHMKPDETPVQFLYRMFHGFPKNFDVYIQHRHARIVKREKIRED